MTTGLLAGPQVLADVSSGGSWGGSEDAERVLRAQELYEQQKKNPWLALGLETLAPGLGNYYAGELDDAGLTWTGFAIGAFSLSYGMGWFCKGLSEDTSKCGTDTYQVVNGIVFLIGSRIFGLIGAPMNVTRNNRALRASLGIGDEYALVPWQAGGGRGLALRMGF
jgi:hypothetical protein